MCENLSISELYTAGIPDNVMKTLILDIKFNEDYFERVIHHEVFHIIHLQHKVFLTRKSGLDLIILTLNMLNVLHVQKK